MQDVVHSSLCYFDAVNMSLIDFQTWSSHRSRMLRPGITFFCVNAHRQHVLCISSACLSFPHLHYNSLLGMWNRRLIFLHFNSILTLFLRGAIEWNPLRSLYCRALNFVSKGSQLGLL